LKKELESRGVDVVIPSMLNPDYPDCKEWVNTIKKNVALLQRRTLLIGHSLGCISILRYLETLKPGQKIHAAILVAGFTDELGTPELQSFFAKPIQWSKIKSHYDKLIAIHSDNDPHVALKYGDIFKEKLGAKLIVCHNMKHFSGDDGITEFPRILEEILNIIG